MIEMQPEAQEQHAEQMLSPWEYKGEFRPYLDELQQLLQYDDADKAAVHEIMKGAVRNIKGLLPDPNFHEAVDATAGIYTWLLAGDNRDPLPRGILAVVKEGSSPNISLDYRIAEVSDYMPELHKQLYDHGLTKARAYMRPIHEQSMAGLEAWAMRYLENNMVSRFLGSFAQPDVLPDKAPLSGYWRQVKESQIDYDIRRRHAIGSRDMPRGTAAHKELGRRLLQLDDEVMTTTNQKMVSPYGRLTDYIDKVFVRAAAENEFTVHKTFVVEDNDSQLGKKLVLEGMFAPNEDYLDPEMTYVDYVEFIASSVCLSIERDALVDRDNPLSSLDNHHANLLGEVLSMPELRAQFSTIEACNTFVMGFVARDFARKHMRYVVDNWGFTDDIASAVRLRESSAQMVFNSKEVNDLSRRHWNTRWSAAFNRPSYVHASSHESQNEAEDRYAGLIKGRLHAAPGMRLISSRMRTAPLVESYPPEYDVAFRCRVDSVAWNPHDAIEFHIPGYRTIAVVDHGDESTSYMVRDPDGDPYATCDVAFDDKQQDTIRSVFQTIGIEKNLDQQLQTVADLVSYIRSNSDYVYSDDPEIADMYQSFDATDARRIRHVLEDYRLLAKNGRLKLQCSGAANVLSAVLNTIYGKTCAVEISGYVAEPGRSRVSGLRHAQVLFVHDGIQYVLDATPSDPNNTVRAHGVNSEYSMYRQANDEQPLTPRRIPDSSQARTIGTNDDEQSRQLQPAVLPEKSADEQAGELLGTMHSWLKRLTKSGTDDELYSQLIKRSEYDPLRLTLSTIRAAEQGLASPKNPAGALTFLDDYRNASAENRKRARLAHYEPVVIDQLEAFLKTYQSIRHL